MLSQSSRQEILRKIATTVGYQFNEAELTPSTRQAITNLATVQRHLYVITEILRGEQSRIDRSVILSTASRFGKDSEKAEKAALLNEINTLQSEIDSKVGDLAKQVLDEGNARQSGNPPPLYSGKLEVVS